MIMFLKMESYEHGAWGMEIEGRGLRNSLPNVFLKDYGFALKLAIC